MQLHLIKNKYEKRKIKTTPQGLPWQSNGLRKWVWSLIGQLRSHMPLSIAKKKERKKGNPTNPTEGRKRKNNMLDKFQMELSYQWNIWKRQSLYNLNMEKTFELWLKIQKPWKKALIHLNAQNRIKSSPSSPFLREQYSPEAGIWAGKAGLGTMAQPRGLSGVSRVSMSISAQWEDPSGRLARRGRPLAWGIRTPAGW